MWARSITPGVDSLDVDAAERIREGRALIAAQLQRLDPFTFWTLPWNRAADFVVVGATGAFLIAMIPALGTLDVRGGRLEVDGTTVKGGRRLRSEARQVRDTLSRATVPVQVQPVFCLTHAIVGAPRSDRGVRAVHVSDLARDIADRPLVLPQLRAQRAARELGIGVGGDERQISADEP